MFLYLIILFVSILIWYIKSCQHPQNFPKGPRLPLPFLGLTGDMGRDMIAISKKYGDGNLCGFWMGNFRAVTVRKFETIQKLLNHPNAEGRQPIAANYLRGGYSMDKSPPGIIFSHGKTWKDLRGITMHYMKDLGMGKKVFDDLIEQQADFLIEYIESHCLDTPVYVDQLFFRATLSVIWRIIADESLPFEHERLETVFTSVKEYLDDMGSLLVQSTMHSELLSKVIEFLGLSTQKQSHVKLFKEIENVIENIQLNGSDCTITEAFLDRMKTDENNPLLEGQLGKLNLRNVLLDLIIGATDTTSCSLQWSLLYLLKYPDCQSRIEEEHLLENKPYTDAFILETLRKGCLGPVGVPRMTEADIQMDNYFIPKNTIILALLGDLFQNPQYFPNPEKFDPERFLSYKNDQLKFTPDPKMIIFQMGRRKCPAESMAKLEMKIIIQKLLRKYEIEAGSELLEIPNAAFAKAPLPFKVVFRKRY